MEHYFLPARAWAYAAKDADPTNADAWELVGDMARIATEGKGVGTPACWPSDSMNAYQQASDLGSTAASTKLKSVNQEFTRNNVTQDTLPDCGSEIVT